MQVLADLREKLAPFYSDIGRPSIDPEPHLAFYCRRQLFANAAIAASRGGLHQNSACAPPQ
jgi:hypothetical protein